MNYYTSHYDPATRICWNFRTKGDGFLCRHTGNCPAHHAEKRTLALFGCCRSGSRWFWAATFNSEKRAFGWENTDQDAMAAAVGAVRDFSDGLPIIAHLRQDVARDRLKEFNKQRRATRSASNSKESRPVEYLYNWRGDQFRIIKKTKQRVYYNKSRLNEESAFAYLDYDDDAIGFIPRSRIKADCDFYNPDYRALYLNKPQGRRPAQELPDLKKLKRAMADAHPDRGGSGAAFIAARENYLAALRARRAPR